MLIQATSYIACAISVLLSVIIMASLGQGYMALIFGLTAFVVEVTKYASFQQKSLAGYTLCALLTLLSIAASIGSLQNGMQATQNTVDSYHTKYQGVERHIEALEKTRDAYIAQGYITKSLPLNEQIAALQTELQAIPKPELGASYGMVQTISQVSGHSITSVSNYLYITVAVVVDVCAFFLLAIQSVKPTVHHVVNQVKPVMQEEVSVTTQRVTVRESMNHYESAPIQEVIQQDDVTGRLIEMSRAGLSQRKIALELGLSQASVSRKLKLMK